MSAWLARAFDFRRGEAQLAILAALFHFFVLGGYYFLRPVRDAMGVSRGMDELRWLFTGTSIAALLFVLAFGGVVSRSDRRRFIPLAYGFVIACLGVFAALLIADAASGGGLWVGALKLALFIGVVLFLHRVVLPRLGIGT